VSHDRTEDVAAIDQAATLDTDRAALASWASSVTCMETRASGLEQALFGAA
jgi:hypothetical protein